jgi:hypothetical protein
MNAQWDVTFQFISTATPEEMQEVLETFFTAAIPPSAQMLDQIVGKVIENLTNENENIRPKDLKNNPGGLIDLSESRYVVILPDLHARRDFLRSVLMWKPFDERNVLELLDSESFTLLCLGDGVHSEVSTVERWKKAEEEYLGRYKKHEAIDKEIADSFHLMLVVMLLKIRYQGKFHFLKGNHENILNEFGNGNYPFAKYANEGAMIYEYFLSNYGKKVLEKYATFEKLLPIFAIGSNFIASHSEPACKYSKEQIINYHDDGMLIDAFTWTENFKADKGTAEWYLNEFLGRNSPGDYYFGGHRPIRGLYNKINADRYVQIHNPLMRIAFFEDTQKYTQINLDECVCEVPLFSGQSSTDKTLCIE